MPDLPRLTKARPIGKVGSLPAHPGSGNVHIRPWPGGKEGCELRLQSVAGFAASTLLVLCAAGCTSAPDTTATGSPIVIGADLELSGAYADVAMTYQRALQLKVDQVNAAGGVRGGRMLRLEVRDNRSDPAVSVANVSTFANEPAIAAVVTGWCGECLLNSVKTLNDKGVPTLSLAPATDVAKPVTARKYIFKIGPNSDDQATVLANELQGDGVKSAALVATADVAGGDAVRSLTPALAKVNVTVSGTQQFPPTDMDVSQPVRLALANHPQALVISAFSSRALLAAKSARTAGFTGRIYFDQDAAGELFLTGMGMHQTDGIAMVGTQSMVIDDVIATTPAKVARRQWFNDYTARYGNFSEYSTYAADAVQVIVAAIDTAGDLHSEMRDAIESTQFEGLAGQIHMTPENHSGLTPQALTVLIARGDRWRPA